MIVTEPLAETVDWFAPAFVDWLEPPLIDEAIWLLRVSDIGDYVLTGVKSGSAEWGSIGAVFGAKTVTLGVNEMPSHSHTFPGAYAAGSGVNFTSITATVGNAQTSSSTGGNGAHNNIQPSRAALLVIKT